MNRLTKMLMKTWMKRRVRKMTRPSFDNRGLLVLGSLGLGACVMHWLDTQRNQARPPYSIGGAYGKPARADVLATGFADPLAQHQSGVARHDLA